MNVQQLEQAAIQAHAKGERFSSFWQRHAADVRALEPIHLGRYRKLCSRLLSLVVSGDAGPEPIPDSWPRPEPWELDDLEAQQAMGRQAALQVSPRAPCPLGGSESR